MTPKLIRVGNELAIVVDPKVLEELGIGEKTELELAIEDGCLLISEKGRLRRSRQEQPVPRPRVPTPPKHRRNEPRYGFPKKQPW